MQNTRIRFFGPPTIEREGVPIPGLATRKSVGLLGYLAVRAEAIGREELAALLWEDLSRDRSRSNLRYVLHQISTQLPDCLEIRRNTARFVTPSPYWVDLFAIQEYLALHTADALEQGLGLYRGEFMAGLYVDDSPEFEAWLVIERERWRQRISGALAELVKQQRDSGNRDSGLRSVERWLTLEPWQEAAHRAKMEMLAQVGQTEAAGAQYELCRKILNSELGVAPSPETNALLARIQRGELTPKPEIALGETISRPVFKLGPAPTSILGRDHEIAEIKALIRSQDCRWLTVTGAPGIGKTRLAHQVAQELAPEFADGVLLVDLAPLHDPALVLPLLARQLGIQESEGDSLERQIQNYLQKKSLLIFIDNFEQVAAAAPQVRRLLDAPDSESLRLLLTSRTALHVRGEFEFPLDPLELPVVGQTLDPATLAQNPAVALLVRRMQAVKPRFILSTENARTAAEICVRLDGLPLALELVAANIRWLPIQTIRERLGRLEDVSALGMLTGGARDVPARQHTLRGAIAWSYDLLTAEEKELFARLGVFSGGWTLEFAEKMSCNDAMPLPDWRRALDGLVNQSLVRSPDTNARAPRWSMLETLQEYALERLESSGKTDRVRAWHATMMMEWVQLQSSKHRAETKQGLDAFEQEHDNLRAALKWSWGSPGARDIFLQLVNALVSFWYTRGYLGEAREWLDRALSFESQASVTRAEFLTSKGVFAYRQGQLAVARNFIQEAVALYTQHAEDAGKRNALFYQGMIELSAGNLESARIALEATLDLHRRAKHPDGMARYGMGMYFFQMGDLVRAQQWLVESLIRLRTRNEITVLAYPLLALARVAYRKQEYTRAREYLEEAVSILKETGDNIELAQTLCRLGNVARLENDWATAIARYRAGWQLALQYGAHYTQPQILEGMAGVEVGQGKAEQAAQLLGAARTLRKIHQIPILPTDRIDYEGIITRVQAQLPPERLAQLEQQGAKLELIEIANFL